MIALINEALAGNRRAMARLMSLIEDDTPQAREATALIYPRTGGAHLVGVTGAPGSGKSTLVAQLAAEYRRRRVTVGIVAVDPTSPFSGGALLGDRIRMRALSGDAGVFIRSMASRGSLGGLARNTARVAQVRDACGYQRIMIETVGAGQSEVDIARAAHTTLVIQVPGLGDDIQTLKAGILEIADILIVNKADLDGAARTVSSLEVMLDQAASAHPEAIGQRWRPPVLQTVASEGRGIVEAVDAVEQHVAYLAQVGARQGREQARVDDELQGILRDELVQRLLARVGREAYRRMVERVAARQLDPYAASAQLIDLF